jgi:hypothetical protein
VLRFERIDHTVDFKGEYTWACCLVMVARGDVNFVMEACFNRGKSQTLFPFNALQHADTAIFL